MDNEPVHRRVVERDRDRFGVEQGHRELHDGAQHRLAARRLEPSGRRRTGGHLLERSKRRGLARFRHPSPPRVVARNGDPVHDKPES
jgi:hypothetical protein